jgi:hypothetical protein
MDLYKKGTYVHQPRQIQPIEEYKQAFIQHILHGSTRARLIQKVYRSYMRMRPECVNNHRRVWLRDMVDKLRNKPPFAELPGCLALYQLWEKVKATEDEWNWLREITWYQKPTREAILEDDRLTGKSTNKPRTKSSTHPSTLTSSENTRQRSESPQIRFKSMVMMPTRINEGASSSRFALPEQDENREYVYEAMSRSPSPIVPMSKKMRKFIELSAQPLILAIDIEGVKPDYLEIAAIIADKEEWLSSKVWYLKPACFSKVLSQAKYCHGISPVALSKVKCSTLLEIQNEMKEWLAKFQRPILIISADENPNSDVKEFVSFMQYPYCNVSLPRWVDRPSTFAHRKTQEMKKNKFKVGDVTCNYEEIHCIRLEAKTRPSLVSGAHCGFFDCAEVLTHVEFNRMWQILYKMHQCADELQL